MTLHAAALVVVGGAVVVDTALGVLPDALVAAPLWTLSAVVAVAAAGGARAGMLSGFGAGVLLDLLAGPVALAGVHTLTALAVGVTVGSVGRRLGRAIGFAVCAGAVAVPAAVGIATGLQRLLHPATGGMAELVAAGAAVGALATPVALRAVTLVVGRPLSQTAPRA